MARPPKPWFRKSRQAWFVTIGGVQHNLGPVKKAAFEIFYQLMRQPQAQKVSPHSLAGICDEFLGWVQKNRSAETFEWYRYRLQRFLSYSSDMNVSALRPYHVQKWIDQYPEHSSTTCRNNIRSIKTCLKWAVQQGYIEESPIAHMKVPGANAKDTIVSLFEYQDLLVLIRDQTFHDLVTVTWETGCRPQESLRVQARHVDLKNSRWVFSKQEAKVKTMPRVVYLTEDALSITQRLMLKNQSGPLFVNSKGLPWNKDSVGCAFTRLQVRMGKEILKAKKHVVNSKRIERLVPKLKQTRRTGGQEIDKKPAELHFEAKTKLTDKLARRIVPRYSLYGLRHSWATHALQNGVDALTVAILMGHKDPSTLARTYQHLSHNPEHLLQQARRAAG